MRTLQREFWDGHSVTLGTGFELRKRKGDRELHAICSLQNHQLEFELVLEVNRLLSHSQVCRFAGRSAGRMRARARGDGLGRMAVTGVMCRSHQAMKSARGRRGFRSDSATVRARNKTSESQMRSIGRSIGGGLWLPCCFLMHCGI
jgi:hypothetical protein